MAFLKITGLVWMDILALYAVSALITYLTDVWKLDYTHAADIVNVFWGSVAIMPFTMQYIVDTFMGNYWMVLLSNFAYTLGLGFLSMSTPPILSKAAGNCSEYKPWCIGTAQKILFYTSLTLLALGMSGHFTSLAKLIEDHKKSSSNDRKRKIFLGLSVAILVTLIGAIVIPFIKSWSIRFGITAICSALATIIFLTGTYNYDKAQGSPLTSVFRVIVASASKSFHKCPKNASDLYQGQDQNDLNNKISHTPRLRCLDKAAIVLPNQSQQHNRWKLCSVTEVEETKSIVCMIPMCTTFFLLGVVSSIGNTYFLEQANRMNRKLGRISVPLTTLVLFRDQAKRQFGNCYKGMALKYQSSRRSARYIARVGIAISMIFAINCCITAAKVEKRRLHVVTSHGLLYKPADKIPMSMFWLLPQFLLLGGLDGIAHKSIDHFFHNQAPASMDRYMTRFAMAVFGVGTMGSVISVSLVDKISSRGGNPSWFQNTLNRSRLDRYYWVLATLSAANFVFYILLAIWYQRKDWSLEDVEVPKFNQSMEHSDD